MNRVFLIAAFVFSLVPVEARALSSMDASGTYVGNAGNAAFLLQMAETDGRVTGRFEEIMVRADGSLNETNAAIVGAVDGQTIVLTAKSSGLLTNSTTASGTFHGNVVRLTDARGHVFTLLRSDEAGFHSEVALLKSRSRY